MILFKGLGYRRRGRSYVPRSIAKGVGIGTSAHAVGTSKALQMGEVEGAMSGLSIAVAGVLTAVLCPVFVNLIR